MRIRYNGEKDVREMKNTLEEQFSSYILSLQLDDIAISEEKEHKQIVLNSKHSLGNVVFQDNHIIELQVLNKTTNTNAFYLHFQLTDLERAKELLNELISCMKDINNNPMVKVLLCCTSGLTTSYFATKMKEASTLFKFSYEVKAVSYANLILNGDDFDVILLAPQISYKYDEVKKEFFDKVVINVPPKIFGMYDVKGVMDLISEALASSEVNKKNLNIPEIKDSFNHSFLIISVFRDNKKVHISYALNNKGHVEHVDEVIKGEISISDIMDVIDTMMIVYSGIEAIGLAIPGIIKGESVISRSYVRDSLNLDIGKLIRDTYGIKLYLFNNVNAAALGFHYWHPEFDPLVFYLQPYGTPGGAGIIINDELLKGKGNAAGELQFMADVYTGMHPDMNEVLEQCGTIIRNFVSTIGPEMIVLYCQMIPDTNLLMDYLEEYLDDSVIPNIYKVSDLQYFILLGEYAYIQNNWNK